MSIGNKSPGSIPDTTITADPNFDYFWSPLFLTQILAFRVRARIPNRNFLFSSPDPINSLRKSLKVSFILKYLKSEKRGPYGKRATFLVHMLKPKEDFREINFDLLDRPNPADEQFFKLGLVASCVKVFEMKKVRMVYSVHYKALLNKDQVLAEIENITENEIDE